MSQELFNLNLEDIWRIAIKSNFFILAANSGAGKTTIFKKLAQRKLPPESIIIYIEIRKYNQVIENSGIDGILFEFDRKYNIFNKKKSSYCGTV